MPQIFESRLTEMRRFQVVKRGVVLGRVEILDLELAQALQMSDRIKAKLIRSMILQGGGGGFIYRNGRMNWHQLRFGQVSIDRHHLSYPMGLWVSLPGAPSELAGVYILLYCTLLSRNSHQ